MKTNVPAMIKARTTRANTTHESCALSTPVALRRRITNEIAAPNRMEKVPSGGTHDRPVGRNPTETGSDDEFGRLELRERYETADVPCEQGSLRGEVSDKTYPL